MFKSTEQAEGNFVALLVVDFAETVPTTMAVIGLVHEIHDVAFLMGCRI